MKTHTKNTDFRARYGTWALVAGASEGLGAEFATQLAARGLNLLLIARRKELLEQLAAQLTHDHAIEVRTLPLDLAREDIGEVIEAATGDLEIGLLVYNAALSMIGPYFEISLEDHLKEIAINCRAPLTLSYLLGQSMLKRRRGAIILMSSLSSAQGAPLITNYAATKAGIIGFTKSVALEVSRHGITVNAVCPGFTETDMLWEVPENIRQRILDKIPMGRFGTSEEIAACVRYIVSEGDYMTAQAISINGGVYI